MLKILYAAANNENSKIQLLRFIKAIEGKPYIVKVAAYKKSSPNINIDWTLDCLLDVFKPEYIYNNNDNFQIYFEQIKYFNPDLIISDLEYFTSYAANVLGITLWQCSSSALNHAFTKKQKYNMGLNKKYSYVLNKNIFIANRNNYILENSNCKFIYSHFGDLDNPPDINEGYEWIRPYHNIGKKSLLCKHNIVAGLSKANKKIISFIKNYEDSVAFTPYTNENYNNVVLKNIENESEYFCNLKNSNYFICEGQTSFLADAFYNFKKSFIMMNHEDTECISNSILSENFNLSKNLYNKNISELEHSEVSYTINPNIKFLHEKIEEI